MSTQTLLAAAVCTGNRSQARCIRRSSPRDIVRDLHCGRADTCGTMYGEQTGEVVQTTATDTAAECCTACKGSAQCNTWNYCYCNRGCGSNPKGTCLLKNQTNPFYPRCCWDLPHHCVTDCS